MEPNGFASISPYREFDRLAATLRYRAGVVRFEELPPWRWIYSRANPSMRLVETPRPINPLSLAIHAHECGHVYYQHSCFIDPLNKEREAWLWSFAWLRRFGMMSPEILNFARFCMVGHVKNNPLMPLAPLNPTWTKWWVKGVEDFSEEEMFNIGLKIAK